jgi:hypothetical protein
MRSLDRIIDRSRPARPRATHGFPAGTSTGPNRDWCKDKGRSSVSARRFWPRFREVLAEEA